MQDHHQNGINLKETLVADIQNKVRRGCLGLCHAPGSMNLEGERWFSPPRGGPCEFQGHDYKTELLWVKPLKSVVSADSFIRAKVGSPYGLLVFQKKQSLSR